MRPSTARRIAIGVGAVWGVTALTMLARGDPDAGDTMAQLAALAVTFGGLAWAAYRFRILPRRESFQGQAKEAGLQARPGDPLGLMQLGFALFRRPASARDLENTAWGAHSCRELVVADYWFAPSSNASRDDYRRFVCVIDEPRPGWPDLSVVPTSLAAIVRGSVGLHDVDLESERFNHAFEVRAADRRFATTLLDARMMRWLMEQAPGVGFEVVAGRLMVFEPRLTASLDDVGRALRRFDGFLEHVPQVMPSLFPDVVQALFATPDRPDR